MPATDPGLPTPHDPAASARRIDAVEHNRLRWRCRRGMLENDLILTRFLDARGDALTIEEVAALDRLLDLADDGLWDVLSGRMDPPDAALMPVVAALRSV